LNIGKVNSKGTVFFGPNLIQQRGYNQFKQQRKTNRVNNDGRISEVEELVDTRNDDGPNETDNPSAESRRRHCGIIGIGNRRPDFNIWCFIFDDDEGQDINIWVVVDDREVLCVPGKLHTFIPRKNAKRRNY
jgi:hypothetical protein